jgi:hypothetical protein
VGNKVQKAAEYYRKKYGQDPNVCFVHPSMLAGQDAKAGSISVVTNSTVLPNHFWIGVHQPDGSQP